MSFMREKLSSNSIKERIIWSTIVFFLVFISIVFISYFLLPEGLLKNKNPAQNWIPSNNNLVLTLQIFLYNLISVIVIFLASLFSSKKKNDKSYLSVGYTVFYTLISINAIVLGTWSFSVESKAALLLDRVVNLFDIVHKAALWEMIGQLLITCTIAQISIFKSCEFNIVKSSFKEIKLKKTEKIVLIIGIAFMLIGAIVESVAINNTYICY
jgi:hypothetical protein